MRRDNADLLNIGTATFATANLLMGNDWINRLEVEDGSNLIISNSLNKIYGTLSKSGSGYILSTTGNNIDTGNPFETVTVLPEVTTVTFDDAYFRSSRIPIITGTNSDTQFVVTAGDLFTVNYDTSTGHANIDTATAVSLTKGTIDLNGNTQTVTTPDGSTIRGGTTGSTLSVGYDADANTVTVGRLDSSNDRVVLNTVTYRYTSGNGMSIEVSYDDDNNRITTFKGLDNDKFVIGDYTYTITGKGLVKYNSTTKDYAMWTGSTLSNVANEGIDVTLLTSSSTNYWTPILPINGNITIQSGSISSGNNSSTGTVVLVGDTNNVGDSEEPPDVVYGKFTINGTVRTLTKIDTANTNLTSVRVNGVAVTFEDFDTNPKIIPTTVNGVNASINTNTPLTFTPANGTTFVVNGETYTYNSTAGLSKGSELWSLLTGEYVLPGGDWTVGDGTVTIAEGESKTAVFQGTTSSTIGLQDDGDSSTSRTITATASSGKWTAFGSLDAEVARILFQ